jgi:cytochrome oxidase Cu insertion factor (SCO1/SenC/PrrC family)
MNSDIDFEQYRMGECGMLVRSIHSALAAAVVASLMMTSGAARAQQAAAPTAPPGPSVKDLAPDFTLAGATRYGLLKTPVTLSDFRGRTVVLAFFYQARTKG